MDEGERGRAAAVLPDSSGFIYLKDTGERLGDGAGPKYGLAKYELAGRKSEDLPFERGFWGAIEWMTPGRTLLAKNGFDDVFGLQVVDLEAGQEKQILSTDDVDYARYAYNPFARQLLISEQGKLTFCSDTGAKLSVVPWPDGLDEATRKNPNFSQEPGDGAALYYLAASQGGRVGPDGSGSPRTGPGWLISSARSERAQAMPFAGPGSFWRKPTEPGRPR